MAEIERAALNFVYGKTITAGQRCTSIQEVLVDSEVYDTFREAVLKLCGGIVQGDGASNELAAADLEGGRFSLPPLVAEENQQRVLGLIDQAVQQGATIGYQKPVDPALLSEGWYAPFTIIENVGPENVLYSTEIFGPAAVFTRVSGLSEAIQIINDKIGIVGCIDSQDKNASETFIQNVLRTRIDDGRHGTGAVLGHPFRRRPGRGQRQPRLGRQHGVRLLLVENHLPRLHAFGLGCAAAYSGQT